MPEEQQNVQPQGQEAVQGGTAQEPIVPSIKVNYTDDFVDALERDINKFQSEGYSNVDINNYIRATTADYDKAYMESDARFSEQAPEWFKESNLELKDDKVKRGLFNRIASSLRYKPAESEEEWAKYRADPGKYGLSDKGREDEDIISKEMIYRTDELSKELLDSNNNQDLTINIDDQIKSTRETLNKEFNPSGERTQKNNVDLMMEEAYSEYIVPQLEAMVQDSYKTKGATHRDFLLIDPYAIAEDKKRYVDMGYTGRMVDRAFDKVFNQDKREHFVRHFNGKITKTVGEDNYDEVMRNVGVQIADGANERARNLINKNEIERLEANDRLNELNKILKSQKFQQKGAVDQNQIALAINKTEAEIALLDEELGYDTKSKGNTRSSFWTAMANLNVNKVEHPNATGIPDDVYYRMYDKNMRKILRGDETKEEIIHESEVNNQLDSNIHLKNLPDRLREEWLKSETILLDLEDERESIRTNYTNNKDWRTTAHPKEMEKQLRRAELVRDEIKQETVRFEALSRMYKLNQNVAAEDKHVQKYAEDGAHTWLSIQKKVDPFIDNPNPSFEEARDVIGEIYAEMGIPMDSKEAKETAADITTEIVRGAVSLGDLALKMVILDKSLGLHHGAVALSQMAKSGRTGKIASGIIGAMVEEGKFQIVTGHVGTGASFYVANKAFPTLKTSNKFLDVIWNSFMRSSAGMTMSMEMVAIKDSAIDGLANDKDMMRTIKENFGDMDEAKRRILVELITAAPFGAKAVYDRGLISRATPKNMAEVADHLESNGYPEAAHELRAQAAKFGDKRMFEEMADMMYRTSVLSEEGVPYKGKTISEVKVEYEKVMEERKEEAAHIGESYIDPLENKMITANVDDYFNPSVQFDALEYAGKIETVAKSGVDVRKKNPAQIDAKYAEIMEKTNVHLQEINDRIPATEYAEGELAEPTKSKAPKPRESEVGIKEAHSEVKAIKKDVNFEKGLAKPAKTIEGIVKKLKRKLGKEAFDEYVNKLSGIKESMDAIDALEAEKAPKKEVKAKLDVDVAEAPKKERTSASEFDFAVQNLKTAKTKTEALNTISLIEDVIHKVETASRPEADRLSYVVRRSAEKPSVVSAIQDFRNNLAAYRRGIKDGRSDYVNAMDDVNQMVKSRLTKGLLQKGLTKAEFNTLASKLPKNATEKDLIKRLERVDAVLQKIETQFTKAEIDKVIKRNQPKVSGGVTVQRRLSYVGGSKMEASDILYNNNKAKADHVIARLETVKSDGAIEKGGYHEQLIDAEIAALKFVGERELAMERQTELEMKSLEGELSLKEKIEYEFLELVDGTKMTHGDALRARETVLEIERSGRTVRERENTFNEFRKKLEVDRALEEMGLDAEKLQKMKDENTFPDSKEDMVSFRKGVAKLRKFGLAHDNFATLMERLSVDAPNRAVWEGFFHTYAQDFHRAREASTSFFNRTLNKYRGAISNIYNMDGRSLDVELKKNKQKVHTFDRWVAGEIAPRHNMSVDQAVRLWQQLHDSGNWGFFNAEGYGKTKENKGNEYGAEHIEVFKKDLEKFVVEKSGSVKSLEVGKYQMEVMYPELYAEASATYMKKHGTDLGHRKFYTPVIFEKNVKLDAEGREIDIANSKDILEGSSEFFIKGVAPAFTKVTTKSKNIKYDLERGSEDVFKEYITKLSHYKHFQAPIDRARNLFNSPEMKNALRARFGTEWVGRTLIPKMLDDIAVDTATGDKHPIMNKIKNNFVTANLGANLILFPKQMMSVSAMRVGLRGNEEHALFTKNMADAMINGWDTMRKLWGSEYMQNRVAGQNYNRDLLEAQSKATALYKTGGLKPGNLKDAMLIMTKLGDAGAILLSGQAFYRTKYTMAKKAGLSDKQAEIKAYEEFVKYSKLTQQAPNVEDLDHIQRYGTLGRYATLFQNSPHSYYRVEAASVRNAMAAYDKSRGSKYGSPERTAARKAINKSMRDFMVFHFLLPMGFRAASQGFYAGDDDKGRESILHDPGQLITALLGSASYGFILGDAMRNIGSKVTTGHAFETQVGGVGQDVVSGIEETLAFFLEKRDYEDFESEWRRILDGTSPITWQDVIGTIGTGSEVFGVPGTSIANIAKGNADYWSGRIDDPRAIFGYSQSVMGKYNRAPLHDLMAEFQGKYPDLPTGLDKFNTYMMASTDYRFYKSNKKKLIEEYIMYDHFGAYNEDVNYLYMGAKSNTERAKFLKSIKENKFFLKPVTMGDVKRKFTEAPMTDEEFENYFIELYEFRAIEPSVIKEMETIDLDLARIMTTAMRKAAR